MTTATSREDARAIAHSAGECLAGSRGLSTVRVPLAEAAGHTAAGDLVALSDLPRFDTSAMDGWAVCGAGPWQVGAPILAGDPPSPDPLLPGIARAIATGGIVPAGSCAILRAERGQVRDSGAWPMLHLLGTTPTAGRDIRRAAEEARRGDVVVRAGTVLTSPWLALAAVAGYDEIDVVPMRDVDVVVLGDEVRSGVVRDAFTQALPAAIRAGGGRVGRSSLCADDPDSTIAALASMPGDLIITTGGTSHGPTDFARSSLIALGAQLLFDGVAVRPGHPVMLAELPDRRLILCLPGNPLAALLCFASFAVPLLDGSIGRRTAPPVFVRASSAIANVSRSTRLVPCTVGTMGAQPTRWQGPGMLRGLAGADLVAIVPPGGVVADSSVATLTLPW